MPPLQSAGLVEQAAWMSVGREELSQVEICKSYHFCVLRSALLQYGKAAAVNNISG
jgi:hypothetical protein